MNTMIGLLVLLLLINTKEDVLAQVTIIEIRFVGYVELFQLTSEIGQKFLHSSVLNKD